MEVEWDGNKAVANIEKHAIDFIDAADVFDIDAADVFDDVRLVVEVDRRHGEPP